MVDNGSIEDDTLEDKLTLDALLKKRVKKLQMSLSGKKVSYEPGMYAVGEMCICNQVSIIFYSLISVCLYHLIYF